MFPSKSKVASFVGSKTRKVGSAALSLMSKDQNEPVKSVAAVGSTSKSVTTEEDIPQRMNHCKKQSSGLRTFWVRNWKKGYVGSASRGVLKMNYI